MATPEEVREALRRLGGRPSTDEEKAQIARIRRKQEATRFVASIALRFKLSEFQTESLTLCLIAGLEGGWHIARGSGERVTLASLHSRHLVERGEDVIVDAILTAIEQAVGVRS